MNSAFLSVLKTLFVIVLATSSFAHAADAPTAAVPKIDFTKGGALFIKGDAVRNITACTTCHGAAGASSISQNPKLGGQHATYTHKQLKDFQAPDRNNAIMSMMAKSLTDEDMTNIAAYLESQKAKQGAAKNKVTLDLGKKIYRAGVAE
ncbi:MAG: cytochrome c, partial [Glaciimonas sp.]|nr:cytochrome c [Glaciimonas sp.]